MANRTPRFGLTVRRRAAELILEGHQYRDIQTMLAAEGITPPPSVGWISALAKSRKASQAILALKQAGKAPTRSGWEGLDEPPPPPDAPEPTPMPDLPDTLPLQDRMLAILEYQAAELMRALARATTGGHDMRGISGLSRTLNDTLAELRKLRPDDAPADPDDAPGIPGVAIREAAATARAKLTEYLARAQARMADAPPCPQCGRPLPPGKGETP